jgi:hypothetical protein
VTKAMPRQMGPLANGYDVHELLYKLHSRPWLCLAVVSPDQTPNTLRLANSLAELGSQQRRRPVEVIDALKLDLEQSTAIAHRIESQRDIDAEQRVVIALDSPIANPVAIGVLRVADVVLMLLKKGISRIPEARRIIKIVGRERLIGAVLTVD